jgi:regulator of replication initiation timing
MRPKPDKGRGASPGKKVQSPIRLSNQLDEILREMSELYDQSMGTLAEEGLWMSLSALRQRYDDRAKLTEEILKAKPKRQTEKKDAV